MPRYFIVALSFFTALSFADSADEFAWLSTGGESTDAESVQQSEGEGYVIIDKYGNKTWVDHLDDPNCSFTATKIEGDTDNFDGEISSDVYIENLDLTECLYENN